MPVIQGRHPFRRLVYQLRDDLQPVTRHLVTPLTELLDSGRRARQDVRRNVAWIPLIAKVRTGRLKRSRPGLLAAFTGVADEVAVLTWRRPGGQMTTPTLDVQQRRELVEDALGLGLGLVGRIVGELHLGPVPGKGILDGVRVEPSARGPVLCVRPAATGRVIDQVPGSVGAWPLATPVRLRDLPALHQARRGREHQAGAGDPRPVQVSGERWLTTT